MSRASGGSKSGINAVTPEMTGYEMAEMAKEDLVKMTKYMCKRYEAYDKFEDVFQDLYVFFLSRDIVSYFDFDRPGVVLSSYVMNVARSKVVDALHGLHKKVKLDYKDILTLIPDKGKNKGEDLVEEEGSYAMALLKNFWSWLENHNCRIEASIVGYRANGEVDEKICKKLKISDKELKRRFRLVKKLARQYRIWRKNPVDLMEDREILPADKMRAQHGECKMFEVLSSEVEDILGEELDRAGIKNKYAYVREMLEKGKIKARKSNGWLFFDRSSVEVHKGELIKKNEIRETVKLLGDIRREKVGIKEKRRELSKR